MRDIIVAVLGKNSEESEAGAGLTSLLRHWTTHNKQAVMSDTADITAIGKSGRFSSPDYRFLKEIQGQSIQLELLDGEYFDFPIDNARMSFLVFDPNESTEAQLTCIKKSLQKVKEEFNGEDLGFEYQQLPIIFVRTKVDEDNDWKDQDEKIKALAKEFGLTNFAIVNTSAKKGKFVELEVAVIETLKTLDNNLSMKSEVEKKTAVEKKTDAPLNQIVNSAYTASRFKHTRKARCEGLKKIIAGNISPSDCVWMLMNYFSINDSGSKISGVIKEELERRHPLLAHAFDEKTPVGSRKSILEQRKADPADQFFYSQMEQEFLEKNSSSSTKVDWNKAKEISAVKELLDLLAKKETQIFGFKIFSTQSGREKQHKEMALIYDLARHIYDSLLLSSAKVQSLGAVLFQANNNNAATESAVPVLEKPLTTLTRESIEEVKKQHSGVELSKEAQAIIDRLLPLKGCTLNVETGDRTFKA